MTVGGRACGCSAPTSRCPLLQWTAQPAQPRRRRLEEEEEEEEEEACGSQSGTQSQGGKHTQPPPARHPGRPRWVQPCPCRLGLSLAAISSASTFLPSCRHPPPLPPVIHGWHVAVWLCKRVRVILEVGSRLGGPYGYGAARGRGHVGRQGVPHTLLGRWAGSSALAWSRVT